MGGSNARLTWSPAIPTVYMLCGLQGAGKTTMAAKLALMLKKQGKRPCWQPAIFTARPPSSSCR
jgi:signal recognition particle subunit SRP54